MLLTLVRMKFLTRCVLSILVRTVDKDVEYLREAVTVLQDCFNLATKPYEKPTAIEVELDPSEQTIDL